jgi:hypothetical protein
MTNKTEAPILARLRKQDEAVRILKTVLGGHGIHAAIDRNDIHVREKYICEITGNQSRISNIIYDHIFPKQTAVEVFHYTTSDGFKGIINTGELRLYSLKKRINDDCGELDSFAEKHGFEGYLDDTKGVAFFKTLSENLFYTSLTRIDATNEAMMWDTFGGNGSGVRLKLRISVQQGQRGDLRRIQYETPGRTLLNQIDEALRAACLPPFVPWTTSRVGAFFLPGYLDDESEARLLVKHYDGAPDDRRTDGSFQFWPVPIDTANDVAQVHLSEVRLGASSDRADLKMALAASGFHQVKIV